MTAPFTSGRLRAPEMRTWLPFFGFTAADSQLASSAVQTEIPGLSVYLEARREYVIDGWIGYVAGGTEAIKFALVAPPDAGCDWSLYPLAAGGGGATGVGTIEGIRKLGAGGALEQGAAGGTAACLPHAFVQTRRQAGLLTVRFAQVTAGATVTSIRRGSWLRAQRVL